MFMWPETSSLIYLPAAHVHHSFPFRLQNDYLRFSAGQKKHADPRFLWCIPNKTYYIDIGNRKPCSYSSALFANVLQYYLFNFFFSPNISFSQYFEWRMMESVNHTVRRGQDSKEKGNRLGFQMFAFLWLHYPIHAWHLLIFFCNTVLKGKLLFSLTCPSKYIPIFLFPKLCSCHLFIISFK